MQFQLTYDAMEDRLLLRVNAGDKGILGFWLTRRCCRILWNILQQRMDASLIEQHMPQDASASSWMKNSRSHQASAELTMQEEEQPAELTSAPLLVTSIRHGTHEDRHIIGLFDQKEHGENFLLNDGLLYGLANVLQQVTERSQWDLALSFGESLMPGTERLQ
ncbi:hypothetical protein ACKC9G_06200 [Pokkaliibacter sp. CJK22405]|uniref:hypothetical protein n=1 Tax=Pokkaliibacter sp. CJK22405 TaxID=3384615 RepID=UPI003985167F